MHGMYRVPGLIFVLFYAKDHGSGQFRTKWTNGLLISSPGFPSPHVLLLHMKRSPHEAKKVHVMAEIGLIKRVIFIAEEIPLLLKQHGGMETLM